MARQRTGTLRKTSTGQWQAVVTLPGGKQKRLPPLPLGTSEAKAREFAAHWSEKAATLAPEAPVPSLKTRQAVAQRVDAEAWAELWFRDREASNKTSVRENRGHWEHHIAPVLGSKHPRDWARDDLRALCRTLDDKVRAGKIAHKTAQNIWTTATKMCSDSAEHKRDEIRCRDDNPAQGVRGPDSGPEKTKEFLYPTEFIKVVSSPGVPLQWRRAIALGVYTYLRTGELRVLRWEDVNIDNMTIHVHRAFDRTTGEAKATKGMAARIIPIRPQLLELLLALKLGKKPSDLVIDLPSERDMARGLRRYLEKAKVERASLYRADATRRPIRFHDMRATGLTWLAVDKVEALTIRQLAGHQEFATTQEYIRMATMVGGNNFGEPFPELPESLSVPSILQGNPASVTLKDVFCGADGTRTRGLRRDRPAL